jgi:hypothetical protein
MASSSKVVNSKRPGSKDPDPDDMDPGSDPLEGREDSIKWIKKQITKQVGTFSVHSNHIQTNGLSYISQVRRQIRHRQDLSLEAHAECPGRRQCLHQGLPRTQVSPARRVTRDYLKFKEQGCRWFDTEGGHYPCRGFKSKVHVCRES